MWDDVTARADPAHVTAVLDLLARAAADPEASTRCGGTLVLAVDGHSGSGKTTLARGVVEALAAGTTVEVLHLDEVYPGWDGLAAAVGILADDVLRPLAQGRTASYPRWSWVRGEWAGRRELSPARVLVVEGCGSSVLPAGGYAAASVFVTAERDLRRDRGLARDGETYEPHWERWAAQETELFERDGTRARADLVIDTSSL